MRLPWRRSEPASSFQACVERTPCPLRVLEVDLAEPLPPIPAGRTPPYAGAVVAVRLHTRPLGFVHVAAPDGAVEAPRLAEHVWRALHDSIAAHCRIDGSSVPDAATRLLHGLGDSGDLPCLAARRRLLADPARVTVVVATRDRPDDVRCALPAILAQCYPRFDVLVVDNAPTTSATAAVVAGLAARDQRLRYVREDRAGLGWAHRRGLEEASADIVAFTDDDVHVDRHWLAGLIEGFGATDDVGAVTGLVLPRELETPTQIWYEQYGGFAKGFERRIFDLDEHRPADPLFPFTVGRLGAGASMAFQRAILERAGGFDPALGPGTPARGGEDIDAFFKILASGSRLVYEPAALAYHTHRRDYAGLRSQLATWGVGYTAFLTAAVTARPRLALRLLPRLPMAVRRTLRVRAREHRVAADTYPDVLTRPMYPSDLRRAELVSLPAGPLAYLRGRARVRARLAAERDAAGSRRGSVS